MVHCRACLRNSTSAGSFYWRPKMGFVCLRSCSWVMFMTKKMASQFVNSPHRVIPPFPEPPHISTATSLPQAVYKFIFMMSSCDLKTCISPDILELSQKAEKTMKMWHTFLCRFEPLWQWRQLNGWQRIVQSENEKGNYRSPKFENDPNHAWKRSRSAIVSKKGKKN